MEGPDHRGALNEMLSCDHVSGRTLWWERDLTREQDAWRGSIFGKGESNQGHCRERTAWATAVTMEGSGHMLWNNPSNPLYTVKMCCCVALIVNTKMTDQWLGRI